MNFTRRDVRRLALLARSLDERMDLWSQEIPHYDHEISGPIRVSLQALADGRHLHAFDNALTAIQTIAKVKVDGQMAADLIDIADDIIGVKAGPDSWLLLQRYVEGALVALATGSHPDAVGLAISALSGVIE